MAQTEKAATSTEIAVPAADTPVQLTSEKMLQDNLLMLAMLFAIFYFILIRPQQKRVKAQRDLLGSLAKGNRVITSGGLIGTITKFEGDNIVVIQIAEGVKVRVARSAISEVTTEKAPAGDSANDN